jgi:hypothetical protein
MEKSFNYRLLLFLCAICFIAFPITSAQAVLVSTSFTGEVTFNNNGDNPFGLTVGDTITASAIYDNAVIAADDQYWLDDYTGWDLVIEIGNETFSHSDVTEADYTSFYFASGFIDGIEFFIEDFALPGFDHLLMEDFNAAYSFFVDEWDPDAGLQGTRYLEVEWDFANATDPVPVEEDEDEDDGDGSPCFVSGAWDL